MIQTVILDLDGTVLDGRLRHYTCYREILEEHGYAPVSLESYWRMKLGRVGFRERLAASGAEAIHDVFIRTFLERIEQPNLLNLDRLQPDVIEKLSEWRKQGVRLVLATMRRYPERLKVQLDSLGLTEVLDYVVVCENRSKEVGKAQRVKSAIPDLRPEHCLWVGDTEVDVDAARALGCQVWAVTTGERTMSYLASLSPDFLSPGLQFVDLEHSR